MVLVDQYPQLHSLPFEGLNPLIKGWNSNRKVTLFARSCTSAGGISTYVTACVCSGMHEL